MAVDTNRDKLRKVNQILQKRGYNPTNQLVGFVLTGDPTYITSADGARKLVTGMDTEALLRDVVETYFCDQENRKA